jgi:FlaA1/EpsC-like NDP-sugar epimerase
MTRFNISLQEGVEMALWALQNACGGEIFVPKIPSYRITDVAKAIGPECEHPIVGIRPGEKINEEMITASDSFNTVDLGRYYAILSQSGDLTKQQYCQKNNATLLTPGFAYNSGSNPDFLKIEQIRDLIREHIDPSFTA